GHGRKTHVKTIETSHTAEAAAPILAAVTANSATPETASTSATTISLRSWTSRRDGLEAIGFWALILPYIWRIEFRGSLALDVACVVALGAIPIASFALHRERPWDLGLRFDNLSRSAREVGIATLAAATVIVACGVAAGVVIRPSLELIPIGIGYAVWGLL